MEKLKIIAYQVIKIVVKWRCYVIFKIYGDKKSVGSSFFGAQVDFQQNLERSFYTVSNFYFIGTLFLTAACNFKVGWPIKTRQWYSGAGYTVVAPNQQFFCNGEITTWHYQTITSNGFQALVFRPLDGGHTEYKIVGINDIPAGEINTPITYNISEGDRIKVQRGDVIGWSFEVGVIPYDSTQNNDASSFIRWIYRRTYPADNITYNFIEGSGLYEYSIEATVSMNVYFSKVFRCLMEQ